MEATALPVWAEIAIAVVGTVGTAALGLLAKALSRWADVLAERWKIAAVSRVVDYLTAGVISVWETTLKQAKRVSTDGKLTHEEKTTAKKAVVDDAMSHFGVKHLASLFGPSVEKELGKQLEKALTATKNASRASKLPLA